MKRVAIIDMGTNTFHLLIAEIEGGEFFITHREKVAVKIGMGGINQGHITESGMERALATMKSFRKTLNEAGVENVQAFGTSALRNASNGELLAGLIQAETGIRTEIINGLQEAEYIYKGCRAAIAMGKEKSLIMDIGGGSVEFIIGNDADIFWSHSFEIGGQRLLEKFHKHDPIANSEIENLKHFFSTELGTLIKELYKHKPVQLIGSSGTFDTLSDIYCFRNNIPVEELPETPLTLNAFHEIYKELSVKNREQRMQIPGMIEMRVDMIVVACALIDFLLSKYQFEQIKVSSYSLKEGVLSSMAK